MYFGSVRFFKDMIYSTAICTVLFAALFSMIFGIKASSESAESAEVPDDLPDSAIAAMSDAASEGALNIPDGVTVDEVYGRLMEKGYTSREIVDYIAANDGDYITSLIEEEAQRIYAENMKSGANASDTPTPVKTD